MTDGKKHGITWELTAQKKFELMIAKIPVFLREMAEKKVSQKAEDFAHKESRAVVTEKDFVDAFFAETPFGFHGPMKNDMNELKIDYIKYGYSQ